MSFKVYQANWSWDRKTDYWLSKMCIGKTLNFPCGMSKVGDVRADIDKSVNPNIIADLNKPFETFKKFEFETVICDPPFSMFNKHKWYHRLTDLTTKRIIFSTPMFKIHLGRDWKKQYFITEQSGNFFIRFWQIFDRQNGFL